VDDTDVVYPAGHAIVRLDTDTKVQRLIQAGVNSKGVCALATAANRRYTAFAESMSDKHPVITVYDWPNKRRRKVVNNVDMGSTTVLCMNFSPDTKYLVVQAGAPEFNVFVLHWEKGKVIGRLPAVGTMVRCWCFTPDWWVGCSVTPGVVKLRRPTHHALWTAAPQTPAYLRRHVWARFACFDSLMAPFVPRLSRRSGNCQIVCVTRGCRKTVL
jgi:hypothetical protein